MACHHSSRQLVEDAWDEKMMVREEPPAKRMKITVACMQQPLTDPGPLDILFTMALVLRSRIHGVHDAVKETATKQVAETVDKEEDSDEGTIYAPFDGGGITFGVTFGMTFPIHPV